MVQARFWYGRLRDQEDLKEPLSQGQKSHRVLSHERRISGRCFRFWTDMPDQLLQKFYLHDAVQDVADSFRLTLG